MESNPKVRVVLEVSNRTVDLLEEGYDIAIRVTPEIRDEAGIDIRVLTRGRMRLVASPKYLSRRSRPNNPQDLAQLDTLGFVRDVGDENTSWELIGQGGEVQKIPISPKLVCRDARVTLAAALKGVGIAHLPDPLCAASLRDGSLEEILPGWRWEGIIHLVFPSRRARIPSVRAFIDFMARRIPEIINEDLGTLQR
jgi:DNA-binding transcriptional LysR family regulator